MLPRETIRLVHLEALLARVSAAVIAVIAGVVVETKKSERDDRP
jgi:hypothetical protein